MHHKDIKRQIGKQLDDKGDRGHKEAGPYMGMENKQNRAFIGLPLNRKQMISHIQMCQFRAGQSFTQLVNLTVYILYQAGKQDFFMGKGQR